MKNIILFLFLGCTLAAKGQNLIWENLVPVSTVYLPAALVKCNNQTYMGIGNLAGGKGVFLFNDNGTVIKTTPFLTALNLPYYSPLTLLQNAGGNLSVFSSKYEGTPLESDRLAIAVSTVSRYGDHVASQGTGLQGGILKAIALQSGLAAIYNPATMDIPGSYVPPVQLVGLSNTGILRWDSAYRLPAIAFNMEPLSDTVFEVSGVSANDLTTPNKNLVRFRVSDSGRRLGKMDTVNLDSLNGKLQSGKLYQLPGGGYFFTCNYLVNGNIKACYGKINASLNLVWSHVTDFEPQVLVNADNSVICRVGKELERINTSLNSKVVIWADTIPSSVNGTRYYYDMIGDGGGNIIVSGGNANISILVKIGNAGYQWKPGPPVSNKPVYSTLKTTVYPNPAKGSLYTNVAKPGTFRLYNLQGSQVLGKAYVPGQAVDVSSLKPGVYAYSIITAEGNYTGRMGVE